MTDRIIRQITDHFVSRLPGEVSYYRIEDLKKQDFPDFLVSRIHIELQRNLDESMILPETDWANTQSEAVQHSWQQFLNAIHAEAKLPASYAKAVIETAVADIVEMLAEPRKKITDILFGAEEVLTADELNERSKLLVVYPHFAKVLTGYMRRRTRNELTRSRCNKIVAQVDDKVTRQYTPLQWAQMLDPLFTLGGSRINTNLLRLFFDDRKMHRTAAKFDALDETITRAEFVEALSEPELWDHEDYQEKQSKHSENKEQIDLEKHPSLDDIGLVYENIGEIHKQHPSTGMQKSKPEKIRTSEQTEESEDHKEKDLESELTEAGNNYDEPEEPESSESEEFGPSIENPDQEDETAPEEQPFSLNASFAESEDEEGISDQSAVGFFGEAADQRSEEMEEGEDTTETQPIWMRFRNKNDADKESREEIMPRFVEIEDEQGRWSENLAKRSYEEEAANAENQLKELEERLKKERGYFIDELFNGSDEAYKESLKKIAEKQTWKKASKLIEQDIFRRNNVNIFSAVAVNFIDRLQNFFLEKQNRN